MASKKGFKVDETTKDFISEETIAKVDGSKQSKPTPKKKPSGKKEKKERRVQLVLRPSLYEEISNYAEAKDLSLNRAITEAIISLLENK